MPAENSGLQSGHDVMPLGCGITSTGIGRYPAVQSTEVSSKNSVDIQGSQQGNALPPKDVDPHAKQHDHTELDNSSSETEQETNPVPPLGVADGDSQPAHTEANNSAATQGTSQRDRWYTRIVEAVISYVVG